MDVEAFWRWYDETRGNLSTLEVERRAHVPRGRIGNPASEKRRPSPLVCQAIADGLPAGENVVLAKAGYGEADVAADISVQDVVEYMKRVPAEERALIREYAEWRYRLAISANRETSEA